MRARRLPILDQVSEDGESVVLVGNSVVRLSALATALLADMSEWTESRVLAQSMSKVFGPPPPDTAALDVVETAIRELAAQGLVEHD